MGGIGYLQMQIKGMRAEHRRKKRGENSEESEEEDNSNDTDSDDDDSDEEEGDDDSDEDEGSDDDDDDAGDSDDVEDDDGDDADEEEDDDDSDEEDGIEIGSRVGVEAEEGDWYGEVVGFDDDADTVIVKREDDGDEYEVEWDALFQDD